MLTATELIEKLKLEEALDSPERLSRLGLTFEEALDKLNKLVHKELHDHEESKQKRSHKRS